MMENVSKFTEKRKYNNYMDLFVVMACVSILVTPNIKSDFYIFKVIMCAMLDMVSLGLICFKSWVQLAASVKRTVVQTQCNISSIKSYIWQT